MGFSKYPSAFASNAARQKCHLHKIGQTQTALRVEVIRFHVHALLKRLNRLLKRFRLALCSLAFLGSRARCASILLGEDARSCAPACSQQEIIAVSSTEKTAINLIILIRSLLWFLLRSGDYDEDSHMCADNLMSAEKW
jgi:hypothetical protein